MNRIDLHFYFALDTEMGCTTWTRFDQTFSEPIVSMVVANAADGRRANFLGWTQHILLPRATDQLSCNLMWHAKEMALSGISTAASAALHAVVFAMSLFCAEPCWAWARFPEATPTPVQGEFDDHDPVGLAHGSFLATDCEHHLNIGEKTYCFESDSSLVEFQKDPGLLLKAQTFWSQNHDP